jgi:hypothetical protein
MVLGLAALVLTERWFSRRLQRAEGQVQALLRSSLVEHDSLTAEVVSEALAREAERVD